MAFKISDDSSDVKTDLKSEIGKQLLLC